MNSTTTNSAEIHPGLNALSNSYVGYLLAILSGLLLALPYNYPQLFALTWIAFVPLLMTMQQSSLRKSYLLGAVMGITFYLVAASWIVDFVTLFKDYKQPRIWTLSIIFWIYCSQLPGLLMLTTRWITQRTALPLVLVFPVLAVIFYSLYPMLFSVQLGESQSRFLMAIQGAEFTGVYGVDFMIALCNCLAVSLILSTFTKQNTPSSSAVGLNLGALVLLCLWFSFGYYSVGAWDKKIATWDTVRVGFVQPNETPSAAVPDAVPGFSRGHPPEMAASLLLAEHEPVIIIWPETRFKGYYYNEHVERAFSNQVAALGIPIVFQDVERVDSREENLKYNSATLLDKDGQAAEVYRKTKRVAFGEYLPLFDESETAKQFVRRYFGDFFIDFSAGNEPKTFTVDNLALVPLLCYEVMFPNYVANTLEKAPTGKILLGLSNNGWFGKTLQPYQHLNSSILRTVENRLPLIHVVNNGPSGIALPNGRIILETDYHTTMAMVVDVPNSTTSGGSFFSRYPYVFIGACGFAFIILIAFGVTSKRKKDDSYNSQQVRTNFSTQI